MSFKIFHPHAPEGSIRIARKQKSMVKKTTTTCRNFRVVPSLARPIGRHYPIHPILLRSFVEITVETHPTLSKTSNDSSSSINAVGTAVYPTPTCALFLLF